VDLYTIRHTAAAGIYGLSSAFACAAMNRKLIKSSERFIALVTQVLAFSPALYCVRWCLVRAVAIRSQTIHHVRKGGTVSLHQCGFTGAFREVTAIVVENDIGSNTFHGYLLRFIAYTDTRFLDITRGAFDIIFIGIIIKVHKVTNVVTRNSSDYT